MRIAILIFLLTPVCIHAAVEVTAERKDGKGDEVIKQTDRQNDFNQAAVGDTIHVTTDPIPAADLKIEIDFAELTHKKAGERVMSIFCGETLLTPQLDIVKEAGGFATALTKTYPVTHPGGPVALHFFGIEDRAQFNALRITDASGKVLASVSAHDATLTRPTETTRPFRVLKPEEMIFFNVDHAPFGAYAELVYGLDGKSGGFAHVKGSIPHTGLVLGTIDSDGPHLMPFMAGVNRVKAGSVHRKVLACTDSWQIPGLSWIHYSPSWPLADLDKATLDEKQRFVLPATWIEFTLDNSTGTEPRSVVFGLPTHGEKRAFAGGKYAGFVFDKTNVLAVAAGSCDLLDSDRANGVVATPACLFSLKANAGEKKTLRIIVAHFDAAPSGGSLQAKYFYTTLFPTIDDVIDYAGRSFASAVSQCKSLDAKLTGSGINVYRQFLAGHALHSYRYNTALLIDAAGKPIFDESEGEYRFINTFDLTVDHAFYQLALHPWTLRNILDHFVARYSYRDEVVDPRDGKGYAGGLSFTHDMGAGLNFSKSGLSAYEARGVNMTVEELQNWILCAGLYWKKTGDSAWLHANSQTIHEAFASLIIRDDVDETKRDGVISLVNHPAKYREEITTYDALDHSLQQVRDNLFITVKSWACYVALEAMLGELHDSAQATASRQQAQRAAASIVAHWNSKDRYVPAVFDGESVARVIPAVEPLAYPQQMGLSSAVAFDGPYGNMIQTLHDHLDSILQPGVCLDAKSGGWKLSSTSNNTWQSKVYLSQYVAEHILHLTGDRISGSVDAVHASFEVLGCPETAWSDQLNSSTGRALGSKHYPRGVTSTLWWLTDEPPTVTQAK